MGGDDYCIAEINKSRLIDDCQVMLGFCCLMIGSSDSMMFAILLVVSWNNKWWLIMMFWVTVCVTMVSDGCWWLLQCRCQVGNHGLMISGAVQWHIAKSLIIPTGICWHHSHQKKWYHVVPLENSQSVRVSMAIWIVSNSWHSKWWRQMICSNHFCIEWNGAIIW